jgi:hypothetical protein
VAVDSTVRKVTPVGQTLMLTSMSMSMSMKRRVPAVPGLGVYEHRVLTHRQLVIQVSSGFVGPRRLDSGSACSG